MKSNSQTVKKITFAAVYFALIMIMSFVPFTGFIYILPGFKITTLGLIVVIATWHIGFVGAITTSIGFAFGSFISGALYPSLLGAFFFQHPWIAFAPRILVGLFVYGTIKLMGSYKGWKFVLSVSLGALFNTAFVLGAIWIASKGSAISLIVFANIAIEALVIPILSLSLIGFVKKIRIDYRNIKKQGW